MEDVEGRGSSGSADVAFDDDGVPIIRLSGEIDMSNVDALRRTIEPVVARAPDRVIFDLSALSFMDSSGIALLLQVSAKSESVRVRRPSPLVQRMIEATGLTDILQVESCSRARGSGMRRERFPKRATSSSTSSSTFRHPSSTRSQ